MKWWRTWYLVNAVTLRGMGCFCDGLRENEANEIANKWRETGVANDSEPIDVSSVEIVKYYL